MLVALHLTDARSSHVESRCYGPPAPFGSKMVYWKYDNTIPKLGEQVSRLRYQAFGFKIERPVWPQPTPYRRWRRNLLGNNNAEIVGMRTVLTEVDLASDKSIGLLNTCAALTMEAALAAGVWSQTQGSAAPRA